MLTERPASRRNLDIAPERLVGNPNFIAKRAIVANAIVAQMFPDGSVKGGGAIKMRLGDGVTPFTTDLDAARASLLDEFADHLAASLSIGWEGFTGTLVKERRPIRRTRPPNT